jgi:hypothetical protein
MALLRMGCGHKDYGARYEAHQLQNSMTHRSPSIEYDNAIFDWHCRWMAGMQKLNP